MVLVQTITDAAEREPSYGMSAGLSGRPRFECQTTEETEAWFVESLDKWREAQGLETMVLVGHSLGGYLSACYALAHPERVTHLVLVCPAGAVPSACMLTSHNTVIDSHVVLLPKPTCGGYGAIQKSAFSVSFL